MNSLIRSQNFNRLFNNFDFISNQSFPSSSESFYPRKNGLINLYENEKNYIFVAELPGFDKSEISISVKDNALELKGQRKVEYKEEENVLRFERRDLVLERSFELPKDCDPEQINAEFENGVLSVHIQKKEIDDERKKIEIQ